jgi:molybdenum cofactor cytidylyltransferase
MLFGPIPTSEAEGAVLAHSLRRGSLLLKKGQELTAENVAALLEAGVDSVVVVRYEPGDVPEDEAAARLAEVGFGSGVRVDEAFTGRANMFAHHAGLVRLDAARIDRLNAIHESVTVATLPNFAVVEPGRMVATVKIIPFAAPKSAVDACVALAREAPLLEVVPFTPKRVRLIQTELEATSPKMLDKTVRITADRIAAVGGSLTGETRCPHEPEALAGAIRDAEAEGFDILLIAGASAITDRQDVLPVGVGRAGGTVHHFGMPVDPGNLLLLAELGGHPVLGLPGCARSPKLNGYDWVLQRLAADLRLTPRDVMGMGIGGLLMEIESRPQPRAQPAEGPGKQAGVAAIVLAAGQSRRMGGPNKLLADLDGKPLVRHVAEAALAARTGSVVVVTGHQRAEVERALGGLKLRFAHNPDYAEGLSTSVRRGLEALGPEVEGALVCLGDMPLVSADLLDRLIDSFDPKQNAAIVVPTRQGKRGNPVLWARRFFDAMCDLKGDVGARHLIGENRDAVAEVEIGDAAPLFDVDTPEMLARLRDGTGLVEALP